MIFSYVLSALVLVDPSSLFSGSKSLALLQKRPAKNAPIVATYIPQNFDSNDTAEFFVEVELPSPGYKVLDVNTAYKGSKIEFGVLIYEANSAAAQVVTRQKVEVRLKVLDEGEYDLVSTSMKASVGLLKVGPVPEGVKTVDSHEYASLTSQVKIDNFSKQGRVLALFGFYKNKCQVKDGDWLPVKTASNVIEVLPIVKDTGGENCGDEPVELREEIVIPPEISAGRYLFYIRRAEDHSVSEVADLH